MSDRLFNWLWKTLLEGSYKSLPIIAALVAFNVYALIGTIIPYVQAHAGGVMELSAADILTMQTVPNREQLYHISGSSMVDSGLLLRWIQESTFSSTETSRQYYGLLTIQDRLLVVGTANPIDSSRTTYTGKFSTYENAKILDGLRQNLGDSANALLPVYFLEYRDTFDSGMTFVMVMMSGVFLFTLYTIYLFVRNTLLKKQPV